MTLGEKIYKLRKENNLKYKDIITELGISKKEYKTWEKDLFLPSEDYLACLSKIFNKPLEYFKSDCKQDLIDKNNKILNKSLIIILIFVFFLCVGVILQISDYLFYLERNHSLEGKLPYSIYFTLFSISIVLGLIFFVYFVYFINRNYYFGVMKRRVMRIFILGGLLFLTLIALNILCFFTITYTVHFVHYDFF